MKPKISIPGLILTVVLIAGIIVFAVAMLTKDQTTKTQFEPETEEKVPPGYSESLKEGYLKLNGLTTKQIIETVSNYHHIPVVYHGTKLARKDDNPFRGEINLKDSIKNITAMLNYMGVYVSYDGKKIIAGR